MLVISTSVAEVVLALVERDLAEGISKSFSVASSIPKRIDGAVVPVPVAIECLPLIVLVPLV